MKVINNYDDWVKYYPSEECEIPEGVILQMTFDYPFQLNAHGEGNIITFMYDAKNTYFETAGAAFNAGGFKIPKLFTDLELYELVYHMFKLMLEEKM
jgi:hypothetical protein|tara:strand:+ start:798 stop:1088 length:291 start_codon:yes stop_codon:yes gene_type:complete